MLMEQQTRHLLEVNKRFGNSLLSAVTLSQQSDAFVEEFKVNADNILSRDINVYFFRSF